MFHVGTTQHPTYMCTKVLPQEIKDKVKEEWDSYTQLKENQQWKRMQAQIEFMMSEDHSHLFDQLLEYKDALDTIHNTDYTISGVQYVIYLYITCYNLSCTYYIL